MFQFIPMQAEITLAAMMVIILLADLIMKEPHHKTLRTMACTLMVIQIILNIQPSAGEYFGGMYHCTPVASVVKTILTAGTLLVFMQAGEWISSPDSRHKAGEFYVITMSTLLGMYFMVSAGSFILFYVGLELASIPMACLIAFDKWKHHSAEAGAKFILNSMFSSGLMLYGLSLIYGTCGTTYFADMTAGITGTPLQILAMVFFFAGLGFKLSLVPFHMWTPDTYQGAPTAVAGYLSVISKGAAAFALMSILTKVFAQMSDRWELMLSIVIVATITLANIFAILQDNMKRFMAYSSISQAGYIMLAVMAGSTQGTTSLIYYITVYIVANLAVFGVIGAIERQLCRCKQCRRRTSRECAFTLGRNSKIGICRKPCGIRRTLPHKSETHFRNDSSHVLPCRNSSVRRILQQVLRIRISIQCRPLAGSVPCPCQYSDFALLLSAGSKSHVYHP